jgi:hypothetical protein
VGSVLEQHSVRHSGPTLAQHSFGTSVQYSRLVLGIVLEQYRNRARRGPVNKPALGDELWIELTSA